jgi:hypothetical protein
VIRAKFNFNPRVVGKNIDQVVIIVQQKVAMQLLEGIVNMNPVKSGRSRGNWQVTIGQAATGELGGEEGPWPAAQEAINAGAAVVSSITTLGAIYLTNNVPYITELEKGTSKQAPQGMVQVTLDRIGAQFR